MEHKAPSVGTYLSLVKFGHTVFALPFAGVGFTLGIMARQPGSLWALLFKVLLCMVFARNTAMAFNRLVDARFDRLNPRTAVREIPAGALSPFQVRVFVVVNIVLFILTTATINRICLWLAPVALLVIMGYSYTKRITAWCHVILGIGLGLAPVGAYLAVTGQFSLDVVLLGLAVLCWVSGFDVLYALQDEGFDRDQGLFSVPMRLGTRGALYVSRLLHVLSIGFLFGFAWLVADHVPVTRWLLDAALAVFVLLIILQHRLVRHDDLSRINLAFFTTNGLASVVFGVLTILALVTAG